MSETAQPATGPLLPLPGFLPDAMTFATRFTCALLLAYCTAFMLELDTASSAGVCVGVVMQPAQGMAMSKAIYRIGGTVLGGVVALLVISAFPQDRTMLLLVFAAWMGLCSYAATLMRDFRSYAASLSGYTVAIIDVSGIDDPNGAWLAALNRMAAILIGVTCIAIVNALFRTDTDHAKLVAGLRRHFEEQLRGAQDALGGRPLRSDGAYVQQAALILSLRTEADYAGLEPGHGSSQRNAAAGMIDALLEMLAATRAIARAWPPSGPSAATRATFEAVSGALERGRAVPRRCPNAETPLDATLEERAIWLARQSQRARVALDSVVDDTRYECLPRVALRRDVDHVGAFLNAARTVFSLGLGSVFCILGGVGNVGILLVQLAALVALLATQPNPSKASIGFLLAIPFGAVIAGCISFLLLPVAAGLLPFVLAVAPGAFIVALAGRHERLAPGGPALILMFTLLLSPSNHEGFDFSSYVNTVMDVAIAAGLTWMCFVLVLPVRPHRRLFRTADKIAGSLRKSLQGRSGDRATTLSLSFDRLSNAYLWIDSRAAKRPMLITRLADFADLEASLQRARSGLRAAELDGTASDQDIGAARAALLGCAPDPLGHVAQAMLAHLSTSAEPQSVMRAVSGLEDARILLQRQCRALLAYGAVEG